MVLAQKIQLLIFNIYLKLKGRIPIEEVLLILFLIYINFIQK
jgi:hypothetical protein